MHLEIIETIYTGVSRVSVADNVVLLHDAGTRSGISYPPYLRQLDAASASITALPDQVHEAGVDTELANDPKKPVMIPQHVMDFSAAVAAKATLAKAESSTDIWHLIKGIRENLEGYEHYSVHGVRLLYDYEVIQAIKEDGEIRIHAYK